MNQAFWDGYLLVSDVSKNRSGLLNNTEDGMMLLQNFGNSLLVHPAT
jgi:hypothetical protein